MSSLYLDLTFDKNLKNTKVITLEDEYGVALNLTGASIKAQAREWYGTKLLLDFSDRITITTPVSGVITIVMLAGDTLKIPVGVHQWDAIITFSTGDQMKIGGAFIVNGTITGVDNE